MNNPIWKLSSEAKLRILNNEVILLLTFRRNECNLYEPKTVIPVDINEDNVTFKVENEIYIVKTNSKKIIVSYHIHRKRIQERYQQKYQKCLRS